MERVKFGSEAIDKLVQGVNLLADAVGSTLGPNGKNVVIIDSNNLPHVTKDGATVALNVSDDDPIVNCGIELVREAALRTAKEAGDGTTTSTILARAILNKGLEYSSAKTSVLFEQMDKAVEKISAKLREMSAPVDGNLDVIERIAHMSANQDSSISKLIREAYEKTGFGVDIILDDGYSNKTTLSTTKGMKLSRGYESPLFINDPKTKTFTAQNCNVVVIHTPEISIDKVTEVISFDPNQKYLIISPKFTSEFMDVFTRTSLMNGVNMCLVQAPQWGEFQMDNIKDIAAFIGEEIYVYDDFTIGTAEKVIVSSMYTSIIGGSGELLKDHISDLKAQLQVTEEEELLERLKRRISVLENGTCVIKAGADTEVEAKEKKDRLEDAICAVKAALEEGVLPGGGVSLLRIGYEFSQEFKTSSPGETLIYSILSEPYKLLGIYPTYTTHCTKSITEEMNETAGKYIEKGILDPTKVEIVALKNAVSVAKMILSVACTVNSNKPITDDYAKFN